MNDPGCNGRVPAGHGVTLGAVLDASLRDAVVLRDRHKPGRRAIIDFVVVARSGVWVIDAKTRPGLVEVGADKSGGAAFEWLRVDGQDRTRDVDAMSWQYEVVVRAINDSEFAGVPVVPLLCYTNADWGELDEAVEVCRIKVGWPQEIARLIAAAAAVIDLERVERLAAELDEQLAQADSSWRWFQ